MKCEKQATRNEKLEKWKMMICRVWNAARLSVCYFGFFFFFSRANVCRLVLVTKSTTPVCHHEYFKILPQDFRFQPFPTPFVTYRNENIIFVYLFVSNAQPHAYRIEFIQKCNESMHKVLAFFDSSSAKFMSNISVARKKKVLCESKYDDSILNVIAKVRSFVIHSSFKIYYKTWRFVCTESRKINKMEKCIQCLSFERFAINSLVHRLDFNCDWSK